MRYPSDSRLKQKIIKEESEKFNSIIKKIEKELTNQRKCAYNYT